MLNRVVPSTLRQSLNVIFTRNLSLSTSWAQAKQQQQQTNDPIQQLFITKIREYNEKRKYMKKNSFLRSILCDCLDKLKMD